MKKAFKKRITAHLSICVIQVLRAFFLCVPKSQSEFIGKRLGSLIFFLSKRYRMDGFRTIKTALPHLSVKENRDLCKKNFQYFGLVMTDILSNYRASKEYLEKNIQVEGIHHLDNALKKGKGVLLLTGHFGHWERMNSLLALRNYPLNAISRRPDDPKLTQMLEELRRRFKIEVIYKGNAIKSIFKKLSKNEIVEILADQNSADGFITFFNQPCGTDLGPGVIHARTGCAVITAWCKRIGFCKYIVTIEPEIQNLPNKEEKKGLALMQVYNERLENQVKQAPEQWLWFHDRWKYTRLKGLVK